jgi:hypothetical protein
LDQEPTAILTKLSPGAFVALDAMLKFARNHSADMVDGVELSHIEEVSNLMHEVGVMAEGQ